MVHSRCDQSDGLCGMCHCTGSHQVTSPSHPRSPYSSEAGAPTRMVSATALMMVTLRSQLQASPPRPS